jgi:hypothetical protein
VDVEAAAADDAASVLGRGAGVVIEDVFDGAFVGQLDRIVTEGRYYCEKAYANEQERSDTDGDTCDEPLPAGESDSVHRERIAEAKTVNRALK